MALMGQFSGLKKKGGASLRLDIGFLDDPRPFSDISLEESIELLRGLGSKLGALGQRGYLNFPAAHDLVNFGVELADDFPDDLPSPRFGQFSSRQSIGLFHDFGRLGDVQRPGRQSHINVRPSRPR